MNTFKFYHPNAIKLIAIYLVFIGGCGLFNAQNALAATPAKPLVSSPPPAVVTTRIEAANLLGAARLTVLGLNIYDAKLWVGSGFVAQDYTQHAFALELTYLRKLTGSLIAERSLKEMRRQGAISDAQAADWLAQLKRLIPDVRSGDQLVGIHSADGSTQLFLNGNLIGQTTDTALSRMFFGIWLSAQTSQPKMRLRLLGHSDASLP